MNVYISLLHYPVYDKNHRVVTTSVTNVDVHDIARMGKTYDLAGYFIVTPIEEQRNLISELVVHWTHGQGGVYNPIRKKAFDLIQVVADFEGVKSFIRQKEGVSPLVIGTSARSFEGSRTFREIADRLRNDEGPALLVLGTGWGLEDEFFKTMDVILEPIAGRADYNHLSVRSAASILVDRLLGRDL